MQLTCPCCSARFSIEAVLSDDAARRAVGVALKLPAPIGDLLLRYIALFRPKSRVLSWSRASRLLEELQADIGKGRIERRGRTWVAPMEVWRLALEEILSQASKLTLPMKSHGYLYEIIVGLVDRAEGVQEEAVEKRRRTVTSADRGSPAARSAAEIASDLKHFQGLLEVAPDNTQLKASVANLERELATHQTGGH